jgi:hypothetical protein
MPGFGSGLRAPANARSCPARYSLPAASCDQRHRASHRRVPSRRRPARRRRAATTRAVPARRRHPGQGRCTACLRRCTWRCSRSTRPSARCGCSASTCRSENADGEFSPPFDQRFHQQVARIFRRQRHRCIQILFVKHARHANAGAFPSRFHDQRKTDLARGGVHVRAARQRRRAASAGRATATPAWRESCPSTAPNRARPNRYTARRATAARPAARRLAAAMLAVQDIEHAREVTGAQPHPARPECRRWHAHRRRAPSARPARCDRNRATPRARPNCRPSPRRHGRTGRVGDLVWPDFIHGFADS